MAYKGLVFDLDYTIYDEHEYFFRVFDSFCDVAGCKDKSDGMKRAFVALRRTSRDIFRDILAENGFGSDAERLREELFGISTSIRTALKPYDDAAYLLRRLTGKDIGTGILTNGVVGLQQNKIRCLAISGYFDEVLCARSLGKGCEKPARRAFEEISRKLKIPGANLIFIGDNPATDFKGAKEIGAFTVRLRRGIFKDVIGDGSVDIEVESLKQIEGML